MAAGKSVFLEGYTDSPEFTRVENPVVYMEQEVLPEERGFPLKSAARLTKEARRGAVGRGREPLPTTRCAHPLSQVTNASPDVNQRNGTVAAEIITISDDEEKKVLDLDEEEPEHEMEECLELYDEDSDGEGPEDDTFDFLRSR